MTELLTFNFKYKEAYTSVIELVNSSNFNGAIIPREIV